MDSNSFYPLKIDHQCNLGVTPFGVFCFQCNSPVGTIPFTTVSRQLLRSHLKLKDHNAPDDTSFYKLADSLNKAIQNNYSSVINYKPWIKSFSDHTIKCSCSNIFRRKDNLLRHIKTMKDTNPGEVHIQVIGGTAQTTCSRTIDTSIIQQRIQKTSTTTQQIFYNNNPTATTQHSNNRSSSVATLQENDPSTASSPTSHPLISKYVPIQRNDNRR